ncbi:hypothetical protein [Fusobacterium massiliense]|jgi:hypothetical protein|uniref:hypothetical protein n=1 Tax=Fusobacterium massiliense TaxID=1852365 RepID=UPI0028D5F3E4|nr:hypothetical protein [Fusobacterium massiliense]
MDDKKKMGRPTNDPKDVKLTVRVNKTTNEILEKFCKENNLTKVEGVREAINRLPIKEKK